MPNTHSTLTSLFTDIASAIREKGGTSASIVADAFPSAIRAIPTGGGGGGDDGMYRAMVERTISVASGDASMIGPNAFASCSALTTASFPSATTIGSSAFANCFVLSDISFPLTTTIEAAAFQSCSNLTTLSFPSVTVIGPYAFRYNSRINSISFPLATNIGSYAFYSCHSLTTVSFSSVVNLNSNAFCNCSSISQASFPVVSTIQAAAFSNCGSLLSIYAPMVTTVGAGAFAYCFSLQGISFLKLGGIGSSAFLRCRSISTVILSSTVAGYMSASAFNQCYTLMSLYLLGESLYTLVQNTVFGDTPISTTGGFANSSARVYVRQSLYDTYISATNWTGLSSKIVGLTDEQVQHVIDYGTHIIE